MTFDALILRYVFGITVLRDVRESIMSLRRTYFNCKARTQQLLLSVILQIFLIFVCLIGMNFAILERFLIINSHFRKSNLEDV